MKKSKAISKIEKILMKIKKSDFDDSDIELFFVTVRSLPNVTKNIFEIGSFVAHGDVRDQGIINDIMLRNHLLLNCILGKDKEIIDIEKNQYPKYLPVLVRLQLKLYSDDDLKRGLNLKGMQVLRVRAALNKKNAFLIDGEYCRLTDKIGVIESNVINFVLSKLHADDGIDYDNLINELVDVLRSDIDYGLLSGLLENKKVIFCFLLLLLNQVVFSLRKDVIAKTVIVVSDENVVGVFGLYPFVHENGSNNSILSPVFLSKYLASDVFDIDVTREDFDSNNIEFSDDLKKIIKKTNS